MLDQNNLEPKFIILTHILDYTNQVNLLDSDNFTLVLNPTCFIPLSKFII